MYETINDQLYFQTYDVPNCSACSLLEEEHFWSKGQGKL